MSKGFSKYDSNGNVIYSESIWQDGWKVRHFYKYDEFNRRIEYKRVVLDENFTTYEEYITYYSNGAKTIYTYNSNTKITGIKEYDGSGRMLSEKIIDINGFYTYKGYNQYTKKYVTVTGRDLFYYIWN